MTSLPGAPFRSCRPRSMAPCSRTDPSPATAGSDVAVIMVTAASERDTVRRALGHGVDGYLVKPFSREQFNERLLAFAAFLLGAPNRVGRLGLAGTHLGMILAHSALSVPVAMLAEHLVAQVGQLGAASKEVAVWVVDAALARKKKTAAVQAFVEEAAALLGAGMGLMAVLGLMAVMKNLEDPSKLGHGIAAAFTATIYGIGAANLFFLPVSAKLRSLVEAQALERKLRKNQFGLDDFLDQLKRIRKMGPLTSILGMIPGLAGHQLSKMQVDDRELDRVEAIILSMTPYERRHPEAIKGSRRLRIAKGSGTSVQQVNQLVKQFGEMRKMMKGLSSGKMPDLGQLMRQR